MYQDNIIIIFVIFLITTLKSKTCRWSLFMKTAFIIQSASLL